MLNRLMNQHELGTSRAKVLNFDKKIHIFLFYRGLEDLKTPSYLKRTALLGYAETGAQFPALTKVRPY